MHVWHMLPYSLRYANHTFTVLAPEKKAIYDEHLCDSVILVGFKF